MPKQRKNKLLKDIANFFYSLPILLFLWVYKETDNQWLAALTFLVSLAVLYLALDGYRQWQKRKLLYSDIDTVDGMTGTEFEEYVLELFKHLGYSGRLITNANDSGADMILQKGKERVAVQARRWKNVVGVDAVKQIIGAVGHYAADKGIVFTNSSFSESARELAETNGVELWDRTKLLGLIDNMANAQNTAINKKEQSI